MRKGNFLIGALALGLFGATVNAAPASPAPAAPKTPQELLVQAEGLVSKIASQLNDTRAIQNQARDGRESLRLGCVDNQLVTSRALVKASEATIESLRAAVRSGQEVQAAPLYTMVVTLAAESDATHRAAAACLGSKEVAQKQIDMPLVLPVRTPGPANPTTPPGKPGLDSAVPLGTIFSHTVRVAPASP